MGTSQSGAFTYGELAEPDVAWLRRAADELRAKLRRTVEEVVASGRILAQARRRLGRDRWRPWLAGEAQIPVRSATRLVNVGSVFGGLPEAAVKHFTPTALYTLAEPGVPRSLREYFVGQARDGEEVTASRVQEMLTLQRDTKTDAPLKLATEDEEPEDPFVDPAEVFAKENWFLLTRDLIGTNGTVHLAAVPDAENEDEAFSGFAIDANGVRKHASGGTAEAVVLLLSGGVRKKPCGGRCGLLKPLEDFCKRKDMPDGREYRCKQCERERVRLHTQRKRAAQADQDLKAAS